jgi:hypothetical protein
MKYIESEEEIILNFLLITQNSFHVRNILEMKSKK